MRQVGNSTGVSEEHLSQPPLALVLMALKPVPRIVLKEFHLNFCCWKKNSLCGFHSVYEYWRLFSLNSYGKYANSRIWSNKCWSLLYYLGMVIFSNCSEMKTSHACIGSYKLSTTTEIHVIPVEFVVFTSQFEPNSY